jgi:ABC-type transporter Mla MlaB component
MATIAVARRGALHRLVIRGALAAKDLKRLEHACREALQHQHVPIEIDLTRVTAMDESARTYLHRLETRGASLRGAWPPANRHG